jgi:di/tricarboxylate transporter
LVGTDFELTQDTLYIGLTLFTILALLVALVKEITRPDFLFIGALTFLLVTGVLNPAQAFSGFSNQAVFTVGALFVIASGIQKTRALGFLDSMVFLDNRSIREVLIRMMASASFMSSFLNNTPIVAMLIPQVQQWAERTGHSPSRLLIPLSYASIVGGVVTLIGTSTNLIVSGMLADKGYEPLGLFELTWIGLPAAILVLLYFAFIGYKTLPDHKEINRSAQTSETDIHGFQFDLLLPSGSPLNGKTVNEAGLRALEKVFLIHVVRQGHALGPIGPQFLVQEGDILTFIGSIQDIDALATRKGLQRSVPVLDPGQKNLPLFEAVVAPTSYIVGKTLKVSEFRERFHGVVVGIQRKSETIRGALGHVAIKPGDVLLIESKSGFDEIWNADKDNFYLVTQKGRRDLPISEKAPIALAIMLGMVTLATFNLMPVVTAAMLAAILMVLTGCVNRGQIMGSLNIPILLVIASAIGIGQAIEVTGIAEFAGDWVVERTSFLGRLAVIIGIYIITNILTEIVTNNAAAVLMFPIGLTAGLEMGISPHAIAVTVAVAASASFLTPIGYQTNLMVMSAGRYSFTDYLKAGFPVTIILLAITVFMVQRIWL